MDKKIEVLDDESLLRLINGFPPTFRDAARALYVRGYREGRKDHQKELPKELL